MIHREATRDDLPGLVRLLADDALGSTREDPSLPLDRRYLEAFAAIEADPNNEVIVIASEHELAGMLQLTFLPSLTRLGAWRAQIEGVRIDRRFRGQGLGAKGIEWAIERARRRGCRLVQLTSDKTRPDAIRFYESLGFTASHEGLKLEIG